MDASGNVLPVGSALRDHKFLGSVAFRVLVDPKMSASGVIVYAALSGNNGGVWRSNDSGGHWTRIMAGNATDVALSAASAISPRPHIGRSTPIVRETSSVGLPA